MRSILVLLVLISFIACDPGVEIENLDPSRLISVSCFVSPQDTVFTAFIYRGSPVGSTVNIDSAAVKDALVTLSDGASVDTLSLSFTVNPISNMKSYRYQGQRKNLTLNTKGTYFLTVILNGLKVTATCVIPPPPGDLEISGRQKNDDYEFSVTWLNPELHRYFFLQLDAAGSYLQNTPSGEVRFPLTASLSDYTIFPSDAQLQENIFSGIMKNAYVANSPVLKIAVINVDENVYNHFKTYSDYKDWDSNNSGTIFPNFKQMPSVFSNIRGGVGIFGGMNGVIVEVHP